MAVTIKWNGDSTGLLSFPLNGLIGKLCKVSDEFFTSVELEEYSLFYYINSKRKDYTSQTIRAGDVAEGVTMNYLYSTVFEGMPLVMSISGDVEGLTKGTYFYTTECESTSANDTHNYVCELVLPNAQEETKPLTEITYNGETIAQLNAGETAVIKCAEKRMITDIIIKINS